MGAAGLSVVIPFRNEAPALVPLHRELARVLDALRMESEILFVDDASDDGGGESIARLAATDERVRLLTLTPRAGQSAALEAGFRAATGGVVATMDADLQNDPADLPALLRALSEADCVCGVRVERHDPFVKRAASRVANAVRRRLLDDGISDIGCALRVMRSEPLSRIKLFRGGHRFLPSLLVFEGARVIERPVRHRPRRFGRSSYGILERLAASWLDLVAMLWLARRIDRYDVKEFSRRV